MKRPPQELQEIGYKIAAFYLDKHNGDYRAAGDAVEMLNVQDIQSIEGGIRILTPRPGLFIGRRGDNIIKLQAYLGIRIEIEESFSWNDVLIPLDYDAATEY